MNSQSNFHVDAKIFKNKENKKESNNKKSNEKLKSVFVTLFPDRLEADFVQISIDENNGVKKNVTTTAKLNPEWYCNPRGDYRKIKRYNEFKNLISIVKENTDETTAILWEEYIDIKINV